MTETDVEDTLFEGQIVGICDCEITIRGLVGCKGNEVGVEINSYRELNSSAGDLSGKCAGPTANIQDTLRIRCSRQFE